MADEMKKELPSLPSTWVRWSDVPDYLVRKYGIDRPLMDTLRWELHSELLKGSRWIKHRIPRTRADFGPPGALKEERWSASDTRIVVTDWSLVVFDASSGTIAAEDIQTGEPARISVEVSWRSVEEWFERDGHRNTVRRSRQTQSISDARSLVAQLPPTSTSRVVHALKGTRWRYSDEALAAWFKLRVIIWPPELAFPTAKQDREIAEALFEDMVRVSRDHFEQLRSTQGNTPPEWRKQGPRAPKT